MMNPNYQKHFPVMLPQVLETLAPQDNKVYVDATFGNGGYTEAILEKANCEVIALDRDTTVLPRANALRQKFGSRFEFRHGCFGDFALLIPENIDGAVFDIGVSSMQLDQAERGFSFTKEAPLDMRMSQTGITAADLVNTLSEQELANILYNYGEEKKSRSIARKIVEARSNKKIETTLELANIIYQVIKRTHTQSVDPATRSFQALRIAVNDELNELKKGLEQASLRLNSTGRLVVVDFHSLEDRIVKNIFRTSENPCICPPDFPVCTCGRVPKGRVVTRKPLLPSAGELERNSRAKSAKLRVFERTVKDKGA